MDVIASCFITDIDPFTKNMEEHFNALTKPRHPKEEHHNAWLQSREYIKEKMAFYGLEVELQCFNTSVILGIGDTEEVTNLYAIH